MRSDGECKCQHLYSINIRFQTWFIASHAKKREQKIVTRMMEAEVGNELKIVVLQRVLKVPGS